MDKKVVPNAFLVLVIGAVIIGSSPIWMRTSNVPGPVSSFYRMSIGALTLTIPFIRNLRKKSLDKKGVLLAIFAGLFFGIDVSFWSTGVMLSGASVPTLMANVAPVFVGIGTLIFFKKKLKGRFWVGLLITLAGSSIILGSDLNREFDLGLGALYGLVAAFFYGGFFLFAERSREKLDALSFFWISVTTSAVFLWGLPGVLSQPLTGYDQRTYWIFVFLGVVVQAIGWQLINYSQGKLPASLISTTLLGQPVFTTILAGIFLGEVLSIWQIVGSVTVLFGVLIVLRSKQERPNQKVEIPPG